MIGTLPSAGMSSTLVHDLQFAIELARGAGRIVLDHYGKVERLTKTHAAANQEAVTEADRASQRHIVTGLRKRFARDGIVGEESETGESITSEIPDPNGRVWVIDPIDGTNNFVAGLGNFAVCIGLLERGEPVLGVVYDVSRDLMYSAAKGQGAWLGSTRLSVNPRPLDDSSMLMLTSNLPNQDGVVPGWVTHWLGQTNWKVRMLGTAAIEVIQVAAGVAHGSVTLQGKLWDIAGPAAILLEAGGVLTDLAGRPIFPFNLKNYAGAKVPFLSGTIRSHPILLQHIQARA